MNKTPLVSIIISVFNGEARLESSIKSVINQSYKNLELIIIDGGSTDQTVDIIKKYEEHISYWITEKDNGIYDAWNKGVKKANGEWISFLGSDDIYLSDAVSNYIAYINQSPLTLEFISSKVYLVDQHGKKLRVIGQPWSWSKFKRYMNVAHVGSFHSKSIFEKFGNFNAAFKIVGDYEMLLRVGYNLSAGFLNMITVEMQIGGVSNNNKTVFEETFNAKTNNKARSVFWAHIDDIDAKLRYTIRAIINKK
jgi:glycosyltransferase involved in cell wall biosynthesis